MPERAERLAALSPAKRALVARRLSALAGVDARPVPRPRCEGVNVFRTSFAQERLWFLEQVAPGRAVPNVVGALRLAGRVDDGALRRSVTTLVARHESLRTTFVAIDGRPFQVISPEAAVSVTVTDLRAAGALETREHGAREMLARDALRPFDVAHGPLVRFTIVVVDDDVRLVSLAMHHLVADAWSVEVIIRDLGALYRDAIRGAVPSLPPVSLQYAEYAEWQRDRYEGERGAALAGYWRRRLHGAPYLRLSTCERLSFLGASRTRDLSPALVAAIRGLARREGVTLFATVLTAWKALLARRIGHGDVTVLTPVANRDRSAVAEVVGFFVNLVALRTDVGDDPSFHEALVRTNDTVREALRHQDLPFERVVGVLGVERHPTRPPISPIGFALERAAAPPIDLPGVVVSAVPIEIATGKTELALIVREDALAITLRLEYDRDAHSAGAAEDLLTAVVCVLTHGVARPELRLSEIQGTRIVDPVPADVRDARSVLGRFEAQVGRTPYAVAISAGGTCVSYLELAQRARAVAAALAERGTVRETIVAVWGARGVEWIAAMLGVWCRGAVYLPLEPHWPAARVAQVLRQSRARFLVCGSRAPAEILSAAEDAGCTLVVPASCSAGPAFSAEEPVPSDVAYVVYTSGSTGAPKGAVVEHAGMLNHLDAKIALLGLGVEDRVAQNASAAFDVSIWQCIAALLVGGSVAIFGNEVVRDPAALRAATLAAGVTVLELVPTVLQALLEVEEAMGGATEHLGRVRWVIATGEALAPQLCRRWLCRHPNIPLVNAYGPTECADDVAHQVIAIPLAPTRCVFRSVVRSSASRCTSSTSDSSRSQRGKPERSA